MFEVYTEDTDCYVESLCDNVDVIRACSDKRVVGIKIHCVRSVVDAKIKQAQQRDADSTTTENLNKQTGL